MTERRERSFTEDGVVSLSLREIPSKIEKLPLWEKYTAGRHFLEIVHSSNNPVIIGFRKIWPGDWAFQDWGGSPYFPYTNPSTAIQYFYDLESAEEALKKVTSPVVIKALEEPGQYPDLWERACQFLDAKRGKGSIFASLKEQKRLEAVEVRVPPLEERLSELGVPYEDEGIQLARVLVELMYAHNGWKRITEGGRGILDRFSGKQLGLLTNNPLFSETGRLEAYLDAVKSEMGRQIVNLERQGVFEDLLEGEGVTLKQVIRNLSREINGLKETEMSLWKLTGILERHYRGWIDGLVNPSSGTVADELGVTKSALYSRRWRLKKRVPKILREAADPEFRELLGDAQVLEDAYQILVTKQYGGKQTKAKRVARFLRDWFLLVETSVAFKRKVKKYHRKFPEYLIPFIEEMSLEREPLGAKALWWKPKINQVIESLRELKGKLPDVLTKKWGSYLDQLPKSAFPTFPSYLDLEVSTSDLVNEIVGKSYSFLKSGKLNIRRILNNLNKRTSPIVLSTFLFKLMSISTRRFKKLVARSKVGGNHK